MVRLLYILLFISQATFSQQVTLTLGKLQPSYTGIIVNNGVYSGFPWPDIYSNGEQVVIWKESFTHSAAGRMMYRLSRDGGKTGDTAQVNVTGYGLVTCSNFSLTIIQDTAFITWQTNADSSQLFAAYSVTHCTTWNFIGGIAYHPAANVGAGTGYYAAQFGKIIKMPSGKKLQPYYDAPVASGNQHSGFIEISPNCSTLSLGDTISNQTGGSFPNGTHSEVWVAIIDTGATDATTTMVALERNEQYEAFTHYKRPSGTSLWTRNDTYLLNVLYPIGVIDKYPVTILSGTDSMYLYVGVRALGDYYAAYVSVTKADLFNNTEAGYSSLHRIQDFNADTNGASIDCGYLISNYDYYHKKVTWWYDTSPTYDGTGLRQIIIYQKVLD